MVILHFDNSIVALFAALKSDLSHLFKFFVNKQPFGKRLTVVNGIRFKQKPTRISSGAAVGDEVILKNQIN
jgi:hypothetical protein